MEALIFGFAVDGEMVSLALLASVPVVATMLPVNVGGSIQSSWFKSNTAGLFRCASGEDYSYTPLFSLKKIKQPGLLRRDSPLPEDKDDDLLVQ